jgi:hypothetical protein
MANVMIDIAAEFVGKPAFKQADTATDKLTKNVKKLAGTFGLAFSATAVLAYGKAAVKAAAEDEKAQKQLALALKNVGLGRDAASSEEYIQKLQSEFGIVDDLLRPAYQTLAVATRDTDEAQRLLNLSLDISAATGKDLGSVTGALSRAYLGNNAALSRLGVGISKADLKTKSFKEITDEMAKTFAGSATQSANTFQGSMDKLAVASANVQEIIGTGIIDALKGLGDENSVDDLAKQMESAALYIADSIRGLGVMVGYIQSTMDAISNNPLFGGGGSSFISKGGLIPMLAALGKQQRDQAARNGDTAQALAHLAELQASYTSEILADNKKLTAEERKQLAAKRLKLALDKASLALSKGEEVFDMDKIQNEAALKSQAEALGKATTSQQVLQIANDTARLNVKKSILALEDAMAAKDEASIVAATNKLNADLRVLGTLGMQNIKLLNIKSVLESLKPLDLINISNLEQALGLLRQMTPTGTPAGAASTMLANPANALEATRKLSSGIPLTAEELKLLGMSAQSPRHDISSTGGDYAANYPGAPMSGMSGMSGNTSNTIIVNTGIGDPNAIAEAIDQVLTDAAQRGTLRGYTIG